MLDPARFADTKKYLADISTQLLVDIQAEIDSVRTAFVAAKLRLANESDNVRIQHYDESIAAQERAIAVETRKWHNTVEETEADLQQLLDERDLVRFLLERERA